MNRNLYRLVFNAARGMLVAVRECAMGCGKGRQAGSRSAAEIARSASPARFAVPAFTLAAWIAAGLPCAQAQVIADPNSGANRPTIVQTANGLQQVNITRPSAAGVSTNAYTRFDVPPPGVILNNAPTPVSTQQAGYVNGNPNLLPGGSARIIVNQVTGTSPSQLQGYVEVAGPRSEVVIANPNGLVVNGLGFINTSRATLTTGMPVFGGSGSLDAFRVASGQIAIQGEGMNAANVDQVDLIARAVQANATLYASQLNVIAGANQVDRATLAATPIAGSGTAPALGIDVAQLGGMYASKIMLASTEHGVGVSLRGIAAAQAGELTLTAQGKLVLGGQTNASGNLVVYARDGIDNSGTTYGVQGVSINTDGALANSGTLASQQWLNAYAGSVASTGTLAAGVHADGSTAAPADLTVVASNGALTATGRNLASGNATLQGTGANLAGSQTSAGGNLNLQAGAGKLDLTGANIRADGALNATAGGALVNDGGQLSSQGGLVLEADSLSNQGGQIVAQQAATLKVAGAVNNTLGTIQANGALSAHAGSLDNTAGRIVSLNGDVLSLTTTGALVNAAGRTATGAEGGLIGGNGSVVINAGALTNHGQINALDDAALDTRTLDNDNGNVTAGGTLSAMVADAATNRLGTLSAATLNLDASALDNAGGRVEGDNLAIATRGDLLNRGGTINQYGATDATVHAGGTLDNTQGTIAANGGDLAVSGQSIVNSAGKIQHAGAGLLTMTSEREFSNVTGMMETNGALQATAATLDNAGGSISAQGKAIIATSGDLLNRYGKLYGKEGLALGSGGQIDNTGGSAQTDGDLSAIAAGKLANASGTLSANGAHGVLDVSAESLDNTRGLLTNASDGATTVSATHALVNTGGTLGGNGDVTVNAHDLVNTAKGSVIASGALDLKTTRTVDNTGGLLYGGKGLVLDQIDATLVNDGGQIQSATDASINVANLNNAGGTIKANQDIAVKGAVSGSGEMTAGHDLALDVTGDYANDAANRLHADGNMRVAATGTLTNTGTLAAAGDLTVQGTDVVNAAGADMASTTTTVNATNRLDNAGRIEGDAVQINTATTNNAGTIIGNRVTVQGGDIANTGAAALIAAAESLHLYASHSVQNLDGATLYSAGNLQIARDGTRDPATGLLVNQVGTLINRSATIEAEGDIDIAATQVSNTRASIETEAGTPVTSTAQTLVMWNAGMSGSDLNFHESVTFPTWRWSGENASVSASRTYALMQPVSLTVDKSNVASLDAAAQRFTFTQPPVEEYYDATSRVICTDCPPPTVFTRNLTSNPTQYYQSITDNGSTYTITFWPDWDPARHIRPDDVRMRYDLGVDNHDYSEISRTVTTTTATDRLVSASDPAKIQAGGAIRINADGGAILNQSSTMAAGADLVRSAVGGTVQDAGAVLQQSVSTTETSTFYWHQKSGGNSDTQVVPYPTTPQASTTVTALPAIASANQTVQTSAQDIRVTTVNRLGETVTGSGVTGGSATGAQVAGAAGGPGKPLQTLGTASGGIPNLTLPTNGLYHYQTAPGATYLIATDTRFTQYSKFISSDYMLGQLGLDPMLLQKRLGDGFYEQKLIRDQVTLLTGRTYLAGYSDQMAQYQALMTSGAAYAKAFNLAPGIGLSENQMAQLTTDMVWLVSQEVTLPDGTRQSVLVPKLYLAHSHAVDLTSTGALVTGGKIELDASGDLANSGRIVGDLATQVVGNNIVNRGQIGATGTTVVKAAQDVRNLGGRISGTDTVVSAGRDVVNETQTITSQVAMGMHSASATGVGAVASISGSNNVGVLAGRDVNMAGGTVDAGNHALLAAGRDLNLGTVVLGTTQDSSSRGGNSYYHDQTAVGAGSSVRAGANVVAVAGRDATLTGSTLDAGNNASLIAGRNATVTASLDSNTHSEGSLGGKNAQYTKSSYDEAVSGSVVRAANNATVAAGQSPLAAAVLESNGLRASPEAAAVPAGTGSLAVLGSTVTTGTGGNGGGAARLIAAQDVTVGTVNETHTAQRWSQTNKSGFLSKEQTTKAGSEHESIAVGSTVSANTVQGHAGRDLMIAGSNVVGTEDVTLRADRDLVIGASESTATSSASEESRKSGMLSNGGASVTFGKQQLNESQTAQTTSHTGSVVGSLQGNVSLSAGEGYRQTGSAVTALKGDVDIRAKTVDINAATDTGRFDQETRFRQSGLTIAVSNPVLAAAQTAGQMARAQSQTDDPRLKALAGAATGLAAKNTYDAVSKDPQAAGGVNISITVGASQSDSTQTHASTTAVGSQVNAGGNVRIRAEGAGEHSNINVVGSDIQARNNLVLKADNQVNLQAAANTADQHSSNQSASGGVGIAVSYGSSGAAFGVTANASAARGKADGNDVTWTTSHATAGNALVIDSGGDTNLRGAVASGNQVIANVGGNLNIESLQDTSRYDSKDQSASGSVTVGYGVSGSASVSQQKINSDFASVGEQSAIRAGSGGYQVDVSGNTDLKGGVIAGGVADRNSFATDTLTVSDIQNRAHYSASSIGIGGGFSAGDNSGKSGVGVNQGGEASTAGSGAVPGTELPTTGGAGQGFSVAPPMVAGASGSASSTTQSGISAGTITIRNDAKQQELTGQSAADTVAGLNRDTTNTGNSLSPIFDEKKIKAGFEIVGALQREAGVFLNNRANEAEAAKVAAEAAAKDPNATPEQRVALQQQADDLAKWGQGGTYRQVMTAITAAASGNVTGSTAQFVQSAAVGYFQGLAANQVKQIADGLDSETARAALHAIVGCAGAAAASQACGTGAMGAASASVLGSLLGPTEGMTAQQKQVRENAIQSLVAGVAGAAGANPATAMNGATFEIENNQLGVGPMPSPPIWSPGQAQKPFQTPGKPADPSEAALTGTPDQSGSNQSEPFKQPLTNIVGNILSFPGQVVDGLGAIFSTEAGKPNVSVPPSLLGPNGSLPPGIGGAGTPIPMQPTANPNATAEEFAKNAFNGQTPTKVVNNITGPGSWVAIMPDGTAITYRPAGQASSSTDSNTATVEVNNQAVRNVNRGSVAKFKFPGK
ncbi:hemagglutinin repeat-containing protein [Cupriavidus taiwanensis]|uniref:hemagglutinin repeat-containing protein n=1 Tax=Cupriavidus taiwanensis TaxID=164546 RepID=UPI000E2F2650|nr:hemagglutinin repeat-containing protein [Cupriavidus taiwanensis]